MTSTVGQMMKSIEAESVHEVTPDTPIQEIIIPMAKGLHR
jgi:hypothetical protein